MAIAELEKRVAALEKKAATGEIDSCQADLIEKLERENRELKEQISAAKEPLDLPAPTFEISCD